MLQLLQYISERMKTFDYYAYRPILSKADMSAAHTWPFRSNLHFNFWYWGNLPECQKLKCRFDLDGTEHFELTPLSFKGLHFKQIDNSAILLTWPTRMFATSQFLGSFFVNRLLGYTQINTYNCTDMHTHRDRYDDRIRLNVVVIYQLRALLGEWRYLILYLDVYFCGRQPDKAARCWQRFVSAQFAAPTWPLESS